MPPFAEQVIVLQGGTVVDFGSYTDVISQAPKLACRMSLNMAQGMELLSTDGRAVMKDVSLTADANPKQLASAYPADDREKDVPGRSGTWSTYRYYISQAGRWKTALFLFCCLSSALFANIVSKSSVFVLLKLT